ncbi:uncharacterized protein LOC144179395 isoform X2 [Haemaphysalis longicornis]
MPSYCAMYGCTNTGGRNAVVFHSFPKDPRLAAQWTAACKRQGFSPTKNSQICSDHFPDSAYERSLSLMRENNIPVKGTRLRPGAVPTTYAAEGASPLPRAAFEKRKKREEGDGEGAPPNQVVSVYVMDEVCEDPVSAMVQAECVQGRTVYGGTPSRTRKLPSAPVSLSDREQSIASLLASMSTDCFATADIGVQAGTAKETKATQVAVRLTREKTVQVGLPLPNRPTEDKAVLVNTEVFIPKFVDNLNDRNVRYFTGLPSLKFLKALALCYQNTQPVSARRHFNCVERIVLVLMKLRHNYNNALLTALFNCSVSSCTIMAAQAIPVLAEIFRPLVYLPPREETTKSTPKFFKELSNVRVIIGCMQIPLSQPDSLSAAFHSHSVDRKELTAKYLIAVTTSGLIAHVSRGYGGRTSDGEVFERSGLIELLDAGSDAIMADPSFAIDELCEGRDIEVVRPTRRIYPKRREGDAPTQTYQILSTRVHVERVAHVVKQFKILSAGVPQTMVGGLDEIMIVAAGIANLSDPMIGPHFFV